MKEFIKEFFSNMNDDLKFFSVVITCITIVLVTFIISYNSTCIVKTLMSVQSYDQLKLEHILEGK